MWKDTAARLTWRAWRWERDEIVQINKISVVSQKRLCRLFLTLSGRWLASWNGFNRVCFDLWRHIVNADQLLHAAEVPRIMPRDSVSCRLYKGPTASFTVIVINATWMTSFWQQLKTVWACILIWLQRHFIIFNVIQINLGLPTAPLTFLFHLSQPVHSQHLTMTTVINHICLHHSQCGNLSSYSRVYESMNEFLSCIPVFLLYQ